MLQTINDKAKGWVAYAIVIFISIPFMLFGIGSYLDGGEKVVAATVNGEEIPTSSLTTAALQQKQRLQSIYGGNLPPQFDDRAIRQQVVDNLVSRELLKQSVDANGYRASDAEVGESIRNIPTFQKDGKFDQTTYQQLLTANRLNAATFEQQTRDDLTLQQMTQAVSSSGLVPKQEAELYQSLVEQERSGKTYTIRAESHKSQVVPDKEKIAAFYKENTALFMTDERVKVDYLLVDQDKIAEGIEASDEQLQQYYEDNATDYRTEEQRKVSHILVSTDKHGKEGAEKRAGDLYAQITAKEKTFEELAQKESDDTLAADKAGDMGFLELRDMSPAFAEAAGKLKVDEISAPVLTPAGYEIIKLAEIKPEVIPEFAAVKERVEKSYQTAEAGKIFIEKIEALRTAAFENDGSLDPAATAINAEITTSDWISRKGGEGIGKEAKVRQAAFSNEVVTERFNSALIELSPIKALVVRLNTHEDAAAKPLADVEKEASDAYIAAESRKLTLAKGEALLADLQKSNDWKALETIPELNVEDVKAFDQLKRNDRKSSPQVVAEVFRMSASEGDNKSAFSNIISPNGDYIIVGLSKVVNGATEVSTGGLASFKAELARREQDALLKAMREQAEVVINQSALDN
ncbi:MAG: SurA N-terminal domain-containing protein [Leucothrix sp.]